MSWQTCVPATAVDALPCGRWRPSSPRLFARGGQQGTIAAGHVLAGFMVVASEKTAEPPGQGSVDRWRVSSICSYRVGRGVAGAVLLFMAAVPPRWPGTSWPS